MRHSEKGSMFLMLFAQKENFIFQPFKFQGIIFQPSSFKGYSSVLRVRFAVGFHQESLDYLGWQLSRDACGLARGPQLAAHP